MWMILLSFPPEGTVSEGPNIVWGILQNWTEDLGCLVQGHGSEIEHQRWVQVLQYLGYVWTSN